MAASATRFTFNTLAANNNINNQSKESNVGAVTNMKKLLKCIKRIFNAGKKSSQKDVAATGLIYTCRTEEEHQNWLNEQLEIQQALLY